MKLSDIESRFDSESLDAFKAWAKGQSADKVKKAVEVCNDLGLSNRNGRIGMPEVASATGKKGRKKAACG